MLSWLKNCLFPNLQDRSLIIIDSWTGYKDNQAIEALREEAGAPFLEMATIPAGCTGHCQPLDVHFFRQWKTFTTRLTDCIVLEGIIDEENEIKLYQRNNILKLQSLVHNQFASPRFSDFISYAWAASGYYDEYIEFESPTTFCFNFNASLCETTCCTNRPIVRCSYCEYSLCHECFFVNNHYHGIK
jgi:hypothetical protein